MKWKGKGIAWPGEAKGMFCWSILAPEKQRSFRYSSLDTIAEANRLYLLLLFIHVRDSSFWETTYFMKKKN